jgi:uncharacterized membrane protein YvbJ
MAEIKMEELLTCPKCGESNAKDARHCSGCGASLANVKPGEAKPEKKKVKLTDRLKKKA